MAELRVLTPDDWPVWRELRLAALAEAPHAFGSRLADWQGAGDRAERWRSRLELAGSYNLVALVDGATAGMASGVPTDEPDIAELISMWVRPQARGRGVGDLLVAAIRRWAVTSGARELRLAVAESNEPAEGLYRRHGFRRLPGPGELMPDGRRREYVMSVALPGRQG